MIILLQTIQKYLKNFWKKSKITNNIYNVNIMKFDPC